MKINILVSRTTYGTIEIEVPEGSTILDPHASAIKKRREAKRLGEMAVRENEADIAWDKPEPIQVDSFYTVSTEE